MNHRCPACDKPIEASSGEQSDQSECFPFCSERCKLVDLGAWLDAEYRIVSELQPHQGGDTSEAAFDDRPDLR